MATNKKQKALRGYVIVAFTASCLKLRWLDCVLRISLWSCSVWPDLAKFHHFGKYLKIFGNIFKVYLVLGKVFNSLWHNLYAVGQILIAENGQKLRIQFGHLVTLIMFDLDLMERSYLSLESISMKAYSVKLYGSLNCLSCNYSKILNVNFHIRWECSINKLWPNCHTLRTKKFHWIGPGCTAVRWKIPVCSNLGGSAL